MEVKNLNNKKKKVKGFKKNYVIFCISRLVSDLGTSIFNFSLNLYILNITGSATLFATLISLTMIPNIIVNLFGGVLIDRSNKKKIVILTDTLSGILLIFFAIVFKYNSKNTLIIGVVLTILAFLQATFMLALTASIPNIAPTEDVPKVNSIFQGLGASVRIIGPIVGAFLYNYINLQMIIVLDGISFIISGILEVYLRYDRKTSTKESKKSYKESVKDVYLFLESKKGLKILLLLALISTMVFSASTTVVLPFITYNKLKLDEYQLSQIMASGFIGMIVGMIIISAKKNSIDMFKKIVLFFKLQLLVCFLWSFPLIGIFNNSPKNVITYIFCVLMLLLGILVGFINIPVLSYIQTSTPENSRASIIGIVNTLGQISAPIGIWIYGVMLEKINWGYVVTIPALIIIIFISFIERLKTMKQFFDTV